MHSKSLGAPYRSALTTICAVDVRVVDRIAADAVRVSVPHRRDQP
ncbi:Uncharacterised protein [Mycobacteroides abscessus subsp. abscessus]|nr:Uncharacterised protein [Mycobacteroides abscessus subsp. abscessus]